ncbi:MAG: hypothetical protein NT075_17545, partial [Chloroflexi bacterium]|nr:hypothetical protein [Chloroflexota bacterium]
MRFAIAGTRYRSMISRFVIIFLALLGVKLGFGVARTSFAAPDSAWQTYTNADAGYTVDLPANAQITESDDAALRYKLLYTRLLADSSAGYQGVSILVIEDAASPEAYVAKAYADAGVDVKSAVRPSAPAQINGQAALRLERD